jgi:uncharacterized protein YbjT (DUF2867 family)
MYIVLGGTGHIGASVAKTLLKKGEQVTITTHNDKHADEWEKRGVSVAIVDVHDTDELRKVFKTGERVFLLNPPAVPSTDTVTEEKKTVASLINALKDSGIEKIVAESTYGAQPGDGIGDLGVLYEMEQKLKEINIPVTVIRGAYYMSNWDASLKTAKEEGIIHTFYPIDFKLPMVAPADIGKVAADLLTEPIEKTGLYYVEGPEMYSSADVAKAFSATLGKPVKAVETPEAEWLSALKKMGFSDEAASSMAAMNKLTLKEPAIAELPIRGQTTLIQYIKELVSAQKS